MIKFNIISTKTFHFSEGVDLKTLKTAIEKKYGKPTKMNAFQYQWASPSGVELVIKKGTLGVGLEGPITLTYPEVNEQSRLNHRDMHTAFVARVTKKKAHEDAARKQAVLDDL